KIRLPERVVAPTAATVGFSMKGWSLRSTPPPSPARTAPAIASAACAAMLCARACSSGSTRSRAARSASALRVRVSAWWRTSSTVATAAAASTTTRKAAPEYLNLKVAVGCTEIPIEPLSAHRRDELRGLAQQIQPRCVLHPGVALAEGQGDAVEHELGVQPVTAFLHVTAVGHLGDHVRRAEQVADRDVARIGNRLLDALERHFVTGVVNDLRGHRHPGAEAQPRQGLLQEARAARYVRAGELRAVARVLVVGTAQVADVVKQPGDQADHGARASQAGGLFLLPLVAHDQARR